MEFWGYKRKEGRAGIRNHVLILPTCACGSETARIVASQVRGAVNIVFNTGCSDVAANTAMSQKVLTGFACNPNVYGVVIIGLGCETVPHLKLKEKIQSMTSKPVVSFGIQDEGGTLKTIEKAVRAAREMAAEAGKQQKELCDISNLLLGIECGGSDATSGIASNPAVGELSDLLVDLGASTIMSESIEWIGAEHVLAKRAATPHIHNQIIQICKDYEAHLMAAGQDCRAGQPTPGNKAGGPCPPWTRRAWAVSARAAPARWWRWWSRPPGPPKRAPSSWTRRATTFPPSPPWWPAAARPSCSPPAGARPLAARFHHKIASNSLLAEKKRIGSILTRAGF